MIRYCTGACLILIPFLSFLFVTRSEGEILFSLLALVSDRKLALEKRMAELQSSSMDVDGKDEELREIRLQVGRFSSSYSKDFGKVIEKLGQTNI